MLLEQGCDWKTLTRSFVRDLNLEEDLRAGLIADHQTLAEEKSGVDKEEELKQIDARLRELFQKISIRLTFLQSSNYSSFCRYIILLDGDGEPLSPHLDNSRLFWQFVAYYSVIEKTYFLIHLSKDGNSVIDYATRGILIRKEIEKLC
jgi:hypothetical protein